MPPNLRDSEPKAPTWLAIPLLGLSLLATGCQEETVEPPPPVRPVKMLEVGGGMGPITREYPGRIRAVQQADMAFEVPGRIVEFPVKEGDVVAKGALLARLDPRDYQARVDAARADFDNTEVNFRRAQKLFEEGALAELERDRRRTTMQTSEAKLRTAEKSLEDTELRAPFDGVMARKLVEDFQNVRAKQQILVLQDESALEIRVAVPERDLVGRGRDFDPDEVTQRIKPRVEVAALPGRQFEARVKQLATIADPETRTFEATFVFPTPEEGILAGMTAKVIIDVPGAEAGLRIPARAAISDPKGAPFVWLVDPESMTVGSRPVELGEMAGSEIEILDGLSDGDLIAISGVYQLSQGMEVRRWQR